MKWVKTMLNSDEFFNQGVLSEVSIASFLWASCCRNCRGPARPASCFQTQSI